MSWIDEYARALSEAGSEVEASDEERRAVLALAREIAHGTERVNAPLATYLAGKFVASREEMEAEDALRLAAETAKRLLGPGGHPPA